MVQIWISYVNLPSKTVQCSELDKECKSLREQLNYHKMESRPDTTASTVKGSASNRTLVIGSSIIRDFDQDKLENTDVISISGGQTTDVHKKLTELSHKYKRIAIQVLSNDIDKGKSESDCLKDYALLLKGAKNTADEVIVSSIIPRLDKPDLQPKIDNVNANLQVLCEEENATFINNDDHGFKFNDGSINEGYLWGDKLHLSKAGSNKLARNMKLKCLRDDITLNKRQRQGHKKQQQQSPTQHSFAPIRPVHTNASRPKVQKPHDPRKSRQATCFKCGEASHLANTCWHTNKVRCHHCKCLGHKRSRCPEVRQQQPESQSRPRPHYKPREDYQERHHVQYRDDRREHSGHRSNNHYQSVNQRWQHEDRYEPTYHHGNRY